MGLYRGIDMVRRKKYTVKERFRIMCGLVYYYISIFKMKLIKRIKKNGCILKFLDNMTKIRRRK